MRKIISVILAVCVLTLSINASFSGEAVPAAVYTWGSRGDTVKQIQDKLKRWQYYGGSVDGIYGSQTVEAVKFFQRKNGLTADGIAGAKTLAALGISETTAQSATQTPSGNSSRENDIWALASVISGEARGEIYTGQVAVGAVVINRVKHSSFPNTISGVIYQPGAFDAVRDGQINLDPSESAIRAARDAINGWDPTNGAIYYWNPRTATNKWVLGIPVTVAIGNHNFGVR